MKKVLIGIIIVALGAYIWWTVSKDTSSEEVPTTTAEGSGTSAPSESINPGAASTTKPTMETPTIGGVPAPEPSTAPAPAGGYKNGTFTGPVVDSVYGPVQVAVTVTSGKITTVAVPVYPNSPGNTTTISNRAIPLLKKETIAVQSAKVDIVSGATQTSEAFQVSLSAALAQAS